MEVPVPLVLVCLHCSFELMLLQVGGRFPAVFVATRVLGVLALLILVVVFIAAGWFPVWWGLLSRVVVDSMNVGVLHLSVIGLLRLCEHLLVVLAEVEATLAWPAAL